LLSSLEQSDFIVCGSLRIGLSLSFKLSGGTLSALK
jgi:hypothetical protein